MALNWLDPGLKEREATAEFIQSDEARELRPNCPYPPTYSAATGQFVSGGLMPQKTGNVQQARISLAALEATLPSLLGSLTPLVQTREEWDGVTRKILAAQKDYAEQGNSAWCRMWGGLGDQYEVAKAWMEIIPNEYGMAIVKTGVALIFKLAANSAEKRKKISQAFEDIQQAMTSVDPAKGSFRSHADVASALDELYQAIVDSVNDIILLTAPKTEHRSMRDLKHRFTQRSKHRDVDSVLQILSEKTQSLKEALRSAQHRTVENIERTTYYTAVETTNVHVAVKGIDNKVGLLGDRLSEQLDDFHADLKALHEKELATADARLASAREGHMQLADMHSLYYNDVMSMITSMKKDIERTKTLVDTQARAQTGSPARFQRAVIHKLQFYNAIVDPPWYENDEPDIRGFVSQSANDLDTVLDKHTGDIDARTQTRVASLLQQRRFVQWIQNDYPDLILVLADLPSSAMENITAVSVFCATLITSLISLRRDDVVLHFFCGLHTDTRGWSPGPGGLVRSLIMQLFGYLERNNIASLDFLCRREYVRQIQAHDLDGLCETLECLLRQCPPGTSVYCIVDSITVFEREMWVRDLMTVLGYFRRFAEDMEAAASFKVLLTSSALCCTETKKLVTWENQVPDRVLYLSEERFFVYDGLGKDEMGRQLGQMSISPRSGGHNRRFDWDRSPRPCYDDGY